MTVANAAMSGITDGRDAVQDVDGEEITRLRAEIASLREQLGPQLGSVRTAAITGRTPNVLDMSTTPRR